MHRTGRRQDEGCARSRVAARVEAEQRVRLPVRAAVALQKQNTKHTNSAGSAQVSLRRDDANDSQCGRSSTASPSGTIGAARRRRGKGKPRRPCLDFAVALGQSLRTSNEGRRQQGVQWEHDTININNENITIRCKTGARHNSTSTTRTQENAVLLPANRRLSPCRTRSGAHPAPRITRVSKQQVRTPQAKNPPTTQIRTPTSREGGDRRPRYEYDSS
jgi:hypothetical protein